MQKLHGKDLLFVGFTLFSMFFGAGNLIFPPFLGAQAGTNAWFAFLGFALSAIGLPVLGVIAIARAGGLSTLAGRVHPRFAAVFTLLCYLSIGPCLAIPRTASTSFEMFAPLIGGGAAKQLLYSVVFFAVAFLVALRPEKLTDRLGKLLCPTLIVLILVLFGACLLHPVAAHYGAPAADYASLPAAEGFLAGYQTMDTIAALNFSAVIALNIRARGVGEEKQVVRGTVRAGWIAGAVLLAVYAMLTHAGALSGAAFPGGETGADTLTRLAYGLFGTPGQERFWFMWNDLVNGALGGIVIADTRRLETSFASIDFFESRTIPFVVAINCFHNHNTRTPEEIRAALDLDPQVPMLIGDIRERAFGRDLLLALVDHLMDLAAVAPVG